MLELYYEEVPSFLRNKAEKEASLGRTFRAEEFLQKAELVAEWLENPDGREFPIDNPGYYGFKIITPVEPIVPTSADSFSEGLSMDLVLEEDDLNLIMTDATEYELYDEIIDYSKTEALDQSADQDVADESGPAEEVPASDEQAGGGEPEASGASDNGADAVDFSEGVELEVLEELDEDIPDINDDFLTFEKDIQHVSDLLNAGDYQDAIEAAQRLLEGGEFLSEEAVNRLEDLWFSAVEKQNSHIQALLTHAQNKIDANQLAEAEDLCNQVLQISPDNEVAAGLLRLIASKQAELKKEAINQDALRKLITDLSIDTNTRELENAIRRAENIQDKSEDLERAYLAAKKRFDDARKDDNELTTIMRLGQVGGCYDALQRLKEKKARGEEVFMEEGQNFRDITQVINEAEAAWRAASREAAQTGILETDNFLKAHQFFVARDRLDQLLKLPLVESDKAEIEAKYQEVESALSDVADIKMIRERADRASDPLEALKIVLTIDIEYLDLPEVISYREAYIESAAKWLVTQVNTELGEAIRASQLYKFEIAHGHIKKAREKLFNLWPAVVERPAELVDVEQAIKQTDSEINAQGLLYADFVEKTNQIREMVSDPNQRKAGQKQLEQLKADPKFAEYPLLNDFLFEMVGYQEVSEQVSAAIDAHRNSQWQEAFDISQNLLKSGEVGEFVDQIRLINAEARNELEIIKLRSLINEQNLRSAHELLERLVTRDPKLKNRLAAEENILLRALTVSSEFSLLMEQAKQLEITDLPENLLQALQIYQHVANLANTEPKSGWPKFELNFEIVAARNAFRKLKNKLQASYIKELVSAFHHKEIITPDELKLLAEKASVVRRGGLLETPDQRVSVSWIEIQHGLSFAESLHRHNKLDQAIKVLKDLHKIYPNDNAVQEKLKLIIKEKALDDVNQLLLTKEDPAGALAILNQAASEGFGVINEWDFVFAYIEPYLLLNQFDDARHQLARAGKLGCPGHLMDEQGQQIELERQTYQFECEIEKHTDEKEYYEALLKINQKLDSDFEHKDRIIELQNRVFEQASDDIVEEIKYLRASEEEGDQLFALLRALDLKSLEDLVGLDDELRQSQKLIQPGLESKDQTIKYLIAEANRYAYTDYAITMAIEKARQIYERLSSFSKFLESMGESSEVLERFEKNSTRFQDLIKDLTHINEILEQADDPDLWINAIKSEDFGPIELLTNLLEKTGYAIREIENLSIKKEEWQEDYRFLMGQITKIKGLFEKGEFKETLSELNRAEQRPLQRPSTGMGWKQISDEDHELIYGLLSSRLKVVNIYSEDDSNVDLIGWQAIKSASMACFREMDYWNNAFIEIEKELKTVETIFLDADRIEQDGNLEQQRRAWTNAADSSQALITLITQRTDHPAQSGGARNIKKSLVNTQIHLQNQHDRANDKIRGLSGEIDQLWPSQDKIKLAMESRNLERLEALIKNMETVGPKDTLQESILKTTKATLNRLRQENEKKKSIFDIFRR